MQDSDRVGDTASHCGEYRASGGILEMTIRSERLIEGTKRTGGETYP